MWADPSSTFLLLIGVLFSTFFSTNRHVDMMAGVQAALLDHERELQTTTIERS
jgi:cytochrome c biogenesis factor